MRIAYSQLTFGVPRFAVLALVSAASAVISGSAMGTGCHDLPSSPAQFFGYGNGPGYHAPIVEAPCHQPPRIPRYVYVPCYPAAPYGVPCTTVPGCLTPTPACPRCQHGSPHAATHHELKEAAVSPDTAVPHAPAEPSLPDPAETTLPTPTDPDPAAAEAELFPGAAMFQLGPPIAGQGLSLESTASTMGDLFGPPPMTPSVDVHGLGAYDALLGVESD